MAVLSLMMSVPDQHYSLGDINNSILRTLLLSYPPHRRGEDEDQTWGVPMPLS